MTAYREVLKDKKDLKKIIGILSSLKQKAEVIILPLQESPDEKIYETDNEFGKFNREKRQKKMSAISIDTVGFKFNRDEAHER